MGNGVSLKIFDCCSPKEDYQKGHIQVDKNIYEKINLKTIDLIKTTNCNKIDQNIMKKKSKNSSKNGSLNESKNEKGNSQSLTINNYQVLNTGILDNKNKLKNQQNINIKSSNLQNEINFIKDLDNSINKKQIEPKTKLILSGELFSNKIIEINKNGMKNSLRKNIDGIVIFGLKNPKENSENLFDCILNLENTEEKGKIFQIYFDVNKKVYTLNFVNPNLILYYKINDCAYFDVDKEYYIILSDIFLTIEIKKVNKQEKQINIKVDIENEKTKNYNYSQNEMPIKIGRSNCNININRYSISKIHSFIYFSNNIFYYKDANSTNGSCLLIREDDFINIKGEMHFKLEDYFFKIKEIEDKDDF